MNILKVVLITTSVFLKSSYSLKSCAEKHEKIELCYKRKNGYRNPLPVILETDLHLKEIIDIDEDRNSISLFIDLWTLWTDFELDLSNNSSM